MPQRPSPATPTVGCRHRRRFCRGETITCHKNTHPRVTPHTEAQPWPVDSSTGHPAGHNDHRPQGPQVTCHSAPAWPQATLGSSQPLSHAVSRHSRTTTDVDYRHAQPVYFVCPGQESNTILHWNRRRDAGVRALEIPSCLVPQKRNHCCGAIPPRIFDRASLSNFDWC